MGAARALQSRHRAQGRRLAPRYAVRAGGAVAAPDKNLEPS
jgi:hypothetical protein